MPFFHNKVITPRSLQIECTKGGEYVWCVNCVCVGFLARVPSHSMCVNCGERVFHKLQAHDSYSHNMILTKTAAARLSDVLCTDDKYASTLNNPKD